MKNKLLFRKAVTQLFFSLCLMLCCANSSWAQQVIGSYPIMDGGFEGQTVGALPITAVAPAANTTWSYGTSGTAAISDTGSGTTGPRTGSKYTIVSVNSTSIGRQLISPSATATITSGGSYVVQYYTRNATATMFSIPVGVGTVGNSYAGDGKNTSTTWNKVTQVVTSSATDLTSSVVAFRTKLAALQTSGGFDVDDVVIYAGTAADVTAPEAATAVATPVSGTTVSWGAPLTGGVDGGGYMVVRYASNPNTDNDPNANGIYAVGNTITNGTGSLVGTVVYTGTGTSFTDSVAGAGATDYYKIYTVDKAFNYSTEIKATAVVSTTPTITSSKETLSGFNYTGVGPSASQSFAVSGSNLTNNLVVSTASTDFELSADNFATAGVSSISLSSPTVDSTTLYVRLKANVSGGAKSATVTIASTGANTLPNLSLSGSVTNVYYYNGTGALSAPTSWGVNTVGTGANPTAVTDAYANFVIANGTATTDAAWTLGSNSKVIVGNGAAVTLNVADTFPITGTIDAAANGSVVWKHLLASPTFGTLDNASEVHFQPAAAASYSFGASTAYGNLLIDGVGVVSVSNTSSTPTVKTALTVASGSTLSFTSNASPTISVNAGATATINGKIITAKAAGLFASTGSIPLNASATLILGTSSTIEFARAGSAQTVTTLPSGNYANLTLSDTGAAAAAVKTIAGALTVNGTLTINLATALSTISGATNITMANGSTIVRTSGTIDLAPTFAGKVNVTYNGTGKTQIVGPTTLGSPNVTLSVADANITAGMTVTGTVLTAGTTVASISGTTLVLSQAAATAGTTPTLTFGTVVPQTTGAGLPTVANNALGNLTFDNPAGVVLAAAVKGDNIITNKSNALTLNDADFLNANVQMNAGSELTLNVNADQPNLQQIVFSGATGTTTATTAKLKLNMSTGKQIAFANSSAQNWGTGTIEITGFEEGKIKFGTSKTALTATQLSQIKNMANTSATFKLSDNGYLYYSASIVPGDAFVVTSDNPIYLGAGAASTYVITTTAPNSPTAFALADATNSPLPAGLTLNGATGAITGTPTTPVTNSVVPIALSNQVNSQIINFTFNIKTRTAQAIAWSQSFPAANTYGDAAIALTATTDAPALSVSYSSSNTAVATISGSTLTIVGPGTTTITASQEGNPDYAPATNVSKELVVAAKALTIETFACAGKIYDKTTTATVTGTLAGGLVGSDVVTLVLSGTYDSANAGTWNVTSTSTLAGADAAKYSLTQPAALTNVTIAKKDQTLAGIGGQSVHILGDADYFPYALVTDANSTGVASVDIENPNFTYTSSNPSVATVVTNGQGKQMIHVVGLGTSEITAFQSGTDNFNASPNVPHTLTVLPQPLASWDLYNFNVSSASPQATAVSATQSVSGITTPTIGIGNHTTGTPPSGTVLYPFGSRYRFNSSDWSYAATADPIAPINIETGKYMSVVIQSNPGKRMSLSTLNATFRGAGSVTNQMLSQFAYSTDGVTFTAIGTPISYDIISGIKYHAAIDLSGIAALQNLPAGTTVTLRYYASGKYGTSAPTTNNGRQWGFTSDFAQGNTRALIIGGSLTTVAPTASAQTFCAPATVASLAATGTALKWYDAATGGDALASSAALTTKNYYVSQTLDGQESARTAVAVTIQAAANAGTDGTLSLMSSPSDSALLAALGGADTNGTWSHPVGGFLGVHTYTVEAKSPCTVADTATVTVSLASEIPASPMALCAGKFVADAIGSTSLKFYKDNLAKTTTPLAAATTKLVSGTTYWVTEMKNGEESTPRVPVVVNLTALVAPTTIASTEAKVICKYMGTENLVTFTTTPVEGASFYTWNISSIPGATIEGNATGESITVSFEGVSNVLPANVPGLIGSVTVDSNNALGCPSGKPKVLALTTKAPTAAKSVALSSTAPVTAPNAIGVSVTTITAVKKAGNFVGTTKTLYLIVTDPSLTADHYDFTLPVGVNSVTGATLVEGSTTLYRATYTGTSTVLTFDLENVAPSNDALVFTCTSVGGCGAASKTLSVARAEAGTPKGLVLTDATDATAPGVVPAVLPIVLKKLDSYTGSLKTRTLTLTATPNVTAGSEASKYKWVLPAGVTTTATPVAGEANTYTSESNVISVNLANVGTETAFTFKVYGVNGNGISLLSKDLACTSALPKAPAAIYAGTNTSLTGTKFLAYNPSCGIVTISVPAVFGVENNFDIISGGATIASHEAGSNVATIDLSTAASSIVLKSTVVIRAIATTATGPVYKDYIIKIGTACSTPTRIAPEAATATEKFSAVAYPNPSTEGFRVKSSNGKSFGVQVYDMLGRSIEQRQMNTDAPIGSNYAKGVYNVIVTQDANVKTLRVIKQ